MIIMIKAFLSLCLICLGQLHMYKGDYTMSEILLVTLCAAICGAEDWQDVEDFGKVKIDYLRQFLPYKNGIPSDDTYRRFFRTIDPKQFQELFRNFKVFRLK